MGAFFLDALDRAMARRGVFYVRFMDDVLALSPTRWKPRDAVWVVNRVLGSLGLEKHPDKTFIGRIEKGFDFLGYHFSREELRAADDTRRRFTERMTRFYEQGREASADASSPGSYARRWRSWLDGGLRRYGALPAKLDADDESLFPPLCQRM